MRSVLDRVCEGFTGLGLLALSLMGLGLSYVRMVMLASIAASAFLFPPLMPLAVICMVIGVIDIGLFIAMSALIAGMAAEFIYSGITNRDLSDDISNLFDPQAKRPETAYPYVSAVSSGELAHDVKLVQSKDVDHDVSQVDPDCIMAKV